MLKPRLLAFYHYTYGKGRGEQALLAREKSQYVYRFLVVESGEMTATLGEVRYPCSAGDLVLLPPGVRYRLSAEGALSLYRVAFSTDGSMCEGRPTACLPVAELREELIVPPPKGEELSLLRQGGVFSHTAARRLFFDLLSVPRSSPLWQFFADTALSVVLSELLRQAPPRGGRAEEILAYIDSHPGEHLTAESLAAHFSYHKNHLASLVKRATGMSLGRYLRRARIAYARELMAREGLAPSDVAARLGYYDYSHFYKAYREEYGVSPRAHRSAEEE